MFDTKNMPLDVFRGIKSNQCVCVCVGVGLWSRHERWPHPQSPWEEDWGSPSGTECVPGMCVHYNRKIDLDSCSTEPHVSQVNFTEADVNPNSHRDRKLTDTIHFSSAHGAACTALTQGWIMDVLHVL